VTQCVRCGVPDHAGEGEILGVEPPPPPAKTCTCLLMIHQGAAMISDFTSYRITLATCDYFQACWVIQSFSELHYNDCVNERHVIDTMRSLLHCDKDVPVRLEAAIALQMLLKHQQSGNSHVTCLARLSVCLSVRLSCIGPITQCVACYALTVNSTESSYCTTNATETSAVR